MNGIFLMMLVLGFSHAGMLQTFRNNE
jgi:hypothetical protein